jgi:hypothetical protein
MLLLTRILTCPCLPSEEVEKFLSNLARSCEDWQVAQANRLGVRSPLDG